MAARPMVRGSDVIVKKLAKTFLPVAWSSEILNRNLKMWSALSGHYVITIDQSGVFPKIASQLDYELNLDWKRLSWEEAHVWGMCSLTS